MNIHRRLIWRLRWALWRRLQWVWLALAFILFLAHLNLDHVQHQQTDAMALFGLWLVARIIWKIRP
jgi:hypothetical protein